MITRPIAANASRPGSESDSARAVSSALAKLRSHAALAAGLAHCRGDCAVLLAADLQDPPETVPPLYERWLAGDEVVWAVRESREGDGAATRFLAAIYYRLMQRIGLAESIPAPRRRLPARRSQGDRRLQRNCGEEHQFRVVIILWIRRLNIVRPYEARQAGHSKWTLGRKLKLFVDSLASFSDVPIRAMSLVGCAMAAAGFLYAAIVVVGRLADWIKRAPGSPR